MRFGAEDRQKENPNKWYGEVSLSPDQPITAGQMGTWQLTYTVGRYGVDNGGRMKLAFRLASDWATPQFDRPGEADYFTVKTDGRGEVNAEYQEKGHLRPWFETVTITVSEYPLQEGDRVIMTLGDTSGGGPGTRAQTFCESAFEFRLLVESFETGVFVRVPSSPSVPIIGGDASRLRVAAPSLVQPGEPFCLTVTAEDRWGNPSHSYRGTVEFSPAAGSLPDAYTFRRGDKGVHRFEGVQLTGEGFCRIEVLDKEGGVRGVSNPVRVSRAEAEKEGRWWADLHGQTESTVGTGTVQEYFRYARDVAAVDICTHQGNDFQITAGDWAEIQRYTRKFNQPGRFVTFLGYEWSGNTPAGGDHNVLWYCDDKPIYRSSHWQITDKSDAHTDRYPISELYEQLRDEKAMLIPHIGGRRAVLDYHRTGQAPLVEICSVHGRFEWFLHEAFDRGLKVGVVANGDDHTGRPGAAYATGDSFGTRGGLTCVLAKELTRKSVWEALSGRRTYATTGERIYLSVCAGGRSMGEEFSTDEPPELRVRAAGTAPLHSVKLLNGKDVIYEYPIFSAGELDPDCIRIAWSGARITSRGRHTDWDGRLTITGGRFASAREFAFDNPRQGLIHRGDTELQWISSTSGDLDGLLVRIEEKGDAELVFESGPCTFSFRPDELRGGQTLEKSAGGVNQQVEVSLAPAEAGPRQVSFCYADPEPSCGLNRYWVRLMQADGEMAWSSPIYVNYKPQSG